MDAFLQNIRFTLRQLRKSPSFALVAIITLALGIGANTAFFTLLDQALLRELPVSHPDQLVRLQYIGSNTGRISAFGGDSNNYFSYPMYKDLRDRNEVFSGMLADVEVSVGVQWNNQSELVPGELVSGNYFDVLGVKPALGRLFVPGDDASQNTNPVVVLSFNYWNAHFGGDPRVIDQVLYINGNPFTILGVTAPNFHSAIGGYTPKVFAPMMTKPLVTPGWNDLDNRRSAFLSLVARLKPGVSREKAEAAMTPLWRAIRATELADIKNKTEKFSKRFVQESSLQLFDERRGFSPLRDQIQTPLLIVMAMVGLVVLMACVNVSSLLLVRAAARVKEMSVRYAMGAGRWQIIRQLLIEGMLLGLLGGALGLAIAPMVSAFLTRRMMGDSVTELPFSSHPDVRILLFNFGLADHVQPGGLEHPVLGPRPPGARRHPAALPVRAGVLDPRWAEPAAAGWRRAVRADFAQPEIVEHRLYYRSSCHLRHRSDAWRLRYETSARGTEATARNSGSTAGIALGCGD